MREARGQEALTPGLGRPCSPTAGSCVPVGFSGNCLPPQIALSFEKLGVKHRSSCVRERQCCHFWVKAPGTRYSRRVSRSGSVQSPSGNSGCSLHKPGLTRIRAPVWKLAAQGLGLGSPALTARSGASNVAPGTPPASPPHFPTPPPCLSYPV